MYKRIIALLCSFMLIGSFTDANYATAAMIQPNVPAYSYTYDCSSELYASGSTLTCKSTVTGYFNVTTNISVGQYLQKRNEYGNWINVCDWHNTISNYKGSVTNYNYSTPSGTYRLRSTFMVYAGTNSEYIIAFSNEVTI